VPLLRDVFLFAFVIDAIGSMRLYTEPNILTAGPGTADPAVAPMLNLLVTNLNDGDFGQSAAVGWLLFLVTLAISAVQFAIFRSKSREVE
jgi:ABC-type sugar transport system permease subunit